MDSLYVLQSKLFLQHCRLIVPNIFLCSMHVFNVTNGTLKEIPSLFSELFKIVILGETFDLKRLISLVVEISDDQLLNHGTFGL
jgi:hypothetical protein